MPLTLEIVTPEKKAYSGTVDSVILPTTTGEIQVLPGHIPLLTQIEPGDLIVSVSGKMEHLAVDRGFAQLVGDTITVLAEGAIHVEAIDFAKVEEAQAKAEKALAEAAKSGQDPAEIERLETVVRFAIVQKLAKNRRR